ncbi:hypothetical protein [Nonomuraea endophytica]|uniref:hypothetical protein n=1 Tax=Nonomuraea endophytica TaxID=714136 RepID=UPI0037C91B3D
MRHALAALLLILATLAAAPASADILMTNHGFESGLTGWTQSHGERGVSASTARAWEGGTSALVSDDSGTAVGLESGRAPVTAGTTYLAFAKLHLISGRADLYVRFWNGATLLGSAYTQTSGPLGVWTDVQVKAAAPAGATQATVLLYSGAAATGTAHWDRILFTAQVTNLGVQVESSHPNGTTFGTGADERMAYSVFTGTQDDAARFVVIDTDTEKVVRQAALPGATGGWAAATATDGTVYVGTYTDTQLYKHTPGTAEVAPVAETSGSLIWCLTPGRDRKVYGGTYDTGAVFKYKPGEGRTYLGSAPIWPGRQYVRSIAYDPADDVTYLGTGTKAALVRFDNVSGAKSDILPAKYRDFSMVTTLKWTGGKLLARVEGTLLVLAVSGATAAVEAEIPGTAPELSEARDGKVYFLKDGTLHTYDLATRAQTSLGVSPAMEVTRFGWVGGTLVAVGSADNRARLFKYTPATGQTRSVEIAGAPILPAAINSIAGGPDGKVYSGSYLTGGTGVYDPIRGDTANLTADLMHRGGVSQTDAMLSHDGKLYLATYPGAKLYEQDPARPWAPRLLTSLADVGQSRPYALAGAPDGRIFVGTVPDYGRYDGALTVYDPATGGRTVHRNIVPDQSIVSLAHHDGLVYAGTSIRGALGTDQARASAARFVIYDPATGAADVRPLPGAAAQASTVTDVTVVDGKIWGFAEGYLFVFDPVAAKFTYVAQKFADVNPAYAASTQWRDADLRTVAKDPAHVYGTIGNHLFKIAKSGYAVTDLVPAAAGLDGLATDDLGNLYYKITGRLFRHAL